MAKKETKPKLERSYNIPLRKSFRLTARYKKTPRAVRAVREFLQKHMKAEPESIKLGAHLNDYLWKHGIKNPPHHVKVHVVKEVVDDEELVKAELEGFEYKEAIKSEKKKESTTMKDKLMDKLGAKEGAEEEKEEEEKSPAGEAQEKKAEPAKLEEPAK